MTGYYAQLQIAYTHAPCISPFLCRHRDQPLLLSSCQPSQGDHLHKKKKKKRTTVTTQQLPTVLRRPSPNKVQPLMIYPQRAHTALLDSVLPPASPSTQQIQLTWLIVEECSMTSTCHRHLPPPPPPPHTHTQSSANETHHGQPGADQV